MTDAVSTGTPTDDDGTIRPLAIEFPQDAVDMRRRIAATRLPEQETVDDDSQGVPLATERAYPDDLIHFNRLDRGGHFAAWEQRELFCAEMRAAFRSLH